MEIGLRRMAAGNHFDCLTAAIVKFTQHLVHFSGAQLVARRMRHRRLSAGRDDPLNGLLERGPLTGHESGFAAGQELPEGLRKSPDITLLDQETRKMRARDDGALRQARSARIGAVDLFLFQTPSDFFSPPFAELAKTGEPLLQPGMIRVNVESDNMQCLTFPRNRYLYTGDHAYPTLPCSRLRLIKAIGHIMISESQYLHASRMRPAYQL